VFLKTYAYVGILTMQMEVPKLIQLWLNGEIAITFSVDTDGPMLQVRAHNSSGDQSKIHSNASNSTFF